MPGNWLFVFELAGYQCGIVGTPLVWVQQVFDSSVQVGFYVRD